MAGDVRWCLLVLSFLVWRVASTGELEWTVKVGENASCPLGHVPFGLQHCARCPPGTYAHPQNLSCSLCPVGSYNRFAGRTECSSCHAGSFSREVGVPACQPCPLGRYAASEGSTACERCSPGRVASCAGRTQCDKCSAGQYSSAANDRCNLCPAGTKQPARGASSNASCVLCGPGMHSTVSSYDCWPCPPGCVSEKNFGSTACTMCPAGTMSKDNDCQPCDHPHGSQPGMTFCPADRNTPEELALLIGGILCGVFFLAWACCGLAYWIRMNRRRRELVRQMTTISADATMVSSFRKAIAMAEACGVERKRMKKFKERLAELERRYTCFDSLVECVEDGNTRLVRGSWLAYQCGSRMPRQQDLPPEAFWRPDELRALINHVPVIAVSYCWLHPVHPDPLGEHLRVLKWALHLRLTCKGEGRVHGLAIFLDYLSLPQIGESGTKSNPEPGVPRTHAECDAFSRGLANVNLWYAHQSVSVWLLRWVPERVEHQYEERGWPCFEQAVAGMITDSTKLIDINERALAFSSWDQLQETFRAGRRPPVLPERFKVLLEEKHFTNGHADKAFIARKYQETFEEVVGHAPALWFMDLGWGDEQAEQMAAVLPFCSQLRHLALGGNSFSDAGVVSLVEAAKGCRLQTLDLSRNSVDFGDKDDLMQRWQFEGRSRTGLRLTTSTEMAAPKRGTPHQSKTWHFEEATPGLVIPL